MGMGFRMSRTRDRDLESGTHSFQTPLRPPSLDLSMRTTNQIKMLTDVSLSNQVSTAMCYAQSYSYIKSAHLVGMTVVLGRPGGRRILCGCAS